MSSDAPFTPIENIGEFGLIDRIKAVIGTPVDEDVLLAIDDDAAAYRIGGGRAHVVTTDALIEGVHFDRTFVPLGHLGYKAMAVNVSDVVAMNALPRFATVAIGLPHNMSVEMVETLYHGLKAACETYGVTLVGGDTVASARLMITVTVVGEAGESELAFRSGAGEGDLICVTGDVGGAYAGLKVLLDEKQTFEQFGDQFEPQLDAFGYVIQRQLRPEARLDVIRDWRSRGFVPSALIDISDGIASEINHICRLSGCGAEINSVGIPIDLNTRQTADRFGEDVDTYALFGGEDYELLFTVPEGQLKRIDEGAFSVIGKCTAKAGSVRIALPTGENVALQPSGYRHF